MSNKKNSQEKKVEKKENVKNAGTVEKGQPQDIVLDFKSKRVLEKDNLENTLLGLTKTLYVQAVEDVNDEGYGNYAASLGEHREKMLSLYKEYKKLREESILRPEVCKGLDIELAKAASYLERVEFCIEVLSKIDLSFDDTVAKIYESAERGRKEARENFTRLRSEKSSIPAWKELQIKYQAIGAVQNAGVLKAYQDAGSHIRVLLESWLKAKRNIEKELALKIEGYWKIFQEAAEKGRAVDITPTATLGLGKPNYEKEFKHHQTKLEQLKENLEKLNREVGDLQKEKNDRRRDCCQKVLPLEVPRGTPPDSKAKDAQGSSSFSSSYLEEMLQKAQDKCNQQIKKFEKSLSKDTDVEWLKHLVAPSGSHHLRQASNPVNSPVSGQGHFRSHSAPIPLANALNSPGNSPSTSQVEGRMPGSSAVTVQLSTSISSSAFFPAENSLNLSPGAPENPGSGENERNDVSENSGKSLG